MNKKKKNEPSGTKVFGKGKEIGDIHLTNLAEQKYKMQHLIPALIEIAESEGNNRAKRSFKNALNCQQVLIQSDKSVYKTVSCKSRVCPICTNIKKSKNIVKYKEIIRSWEDPHLVTLTSKSVRKHFLDEEIRKTLRTFTLVRNSLKSKYQRGLEPKFIGIKALECNFNQMTKSYNPHLHIIVPNQYMATTLLNEWMRRNPLLKAKLITQITNTDEEISKLIAYLNKSLSQNLHSNNQYNNPKHLYAKAIYNIHEALNRKHLFRGFGGFKLVQNKEEIPFEILTKTNKVIYDLLSYNYFNQESGEQLTKFEPDSKLSFQMNHINIDID